MALTQRLELRQGQALVMTPQLMQAIKLLQLSSLDLAAYVEAELERNPFLERAAGPDEDPGEQAPPAPEPVVASAEAPLTEWVGEQLETSRSAIEQQLDTDLENVFPSEARESPARGEADRHFGKHRFEFPVSLVGLFVSFLQIPM